MPIEAEGQIWITARLSSRPLFPSASNTSTLQAACRRGETAAQLVAARALKATLVTISVLSTAW